MILGDNSLINKAQSSVDEYKKAAQKEQNLLNDIEAYMGSYGLSENTPDTPAGTHVKPPAKWLGTMVTAVSDGKGNTFPVPKNFYYVGGDYTNGVIISDDPADAYDGITDKTTWGYTTNLVGNQFVWIPCTAENYHKTDWGYVSGGYDTDTASKSEITQVQKYEGFYVSRYEAGLADTIAEFTSGAQTSSPGYNTTGMPKSQANQVPWNYISYSNSKLNAENMYATSNDLASGLITGTQWDVMLNTFIGTTNENGLTVTLADITNSIKCGNYYNNSITYNGRLARCSFNSTWHMYPFGTKTTGNTSIYANNNNGDLLTTGASKITEIYHTYDIAGNLWEWTEEVGQTTNSHVLRGGGNTTISTIGACYRDGRSTQNIPDYHVGFRVVLYIK